MRIIMEKALVTGGLGFIGSHLVESLEARKISVTIIDNFQSNVIGPGELSMQCILEEQSVCDVDLNSIEFDILFHLASPVGPVGVLKYPGRIAEMIICDLAKVRDICIAKRVPLIFISSSEIYGHSDILDEESHKVFPGKYAVRTEYGAAKMLAEISALYSEFHLWQ